MKRLFYGWKMVGAATGLQFLQAGLMTQAFGGYVALLSEERGWSKTSLAGAAALQQMEVALLGPVLGWLLDRFGPRLFVRAGVVLFGLGLMALSRIDTLPAFYACFVLIALGTGFCGFFPLNVAIIHWFERSRARAMSSMSLGLAFGGIVVPLVAWSLQTHGWRATALGSGILAIVIGLPLASMIYNRPEDKGEVVDGGSSKAGPQATGTASQNPQSGTRDFTAREAVRTPAFWLLSLGHGFALFVVHAVTVHAITHLKEGLGYSLEQAALVISLVTLSQVGGVIVGWSIGDRYDKRLIAAACMLMHMTGLLMLTYAANAAMVFAFALLHGMAWGLRGPFMQALRADYFGRSAIGMILGLSFLIIMIGQIGGPMIAGLCADLTGDYRLGFTLLALLVGLGSVFFLAAKKPARPTSASPAA
ncbi:MAG TPA: MFS transporter [Burkholderiales bacterium]|nr:MFS transporter [Burkholderiales bacterium]